MIRSLLSVPAEGVRTLLAHPLRSVLTAMTVAFGTAVLVVLMSYGGAAPQATESVLRSLGSTQIKVTPRWTSGPGGGRRGREIEVRYDDLPAVKAACPSIEALAPGFTPTRGAAVFGPDRSWPWASMMAVGHAYLDVAGIEIRDGRWFTEDEEDGRQRVAVLNLALAEGLFPNGGAVGQFVDFLSRRFEVIGVVFDPFGSSYGMFVPYSSAMGLGDDTGRTVEFVSVKPVRADLARDAISELRSALASMYSFDPNDTRALRVEEQTAFIERVELVSSALQWLLFTIASVALALGCIGAANVVGITVSERVAEIGLRKALGATPLRVRAEVLAESLLLCVGGGVLGIVMAVVALQLLGPVPLAQTVQVEPRLEVRLVAFGLLVLVVAGAFSGVPAARRAAALDPVTALRSG